MIDLETLNPPQREAVLAYRRTASDSGRCRFRKNQSADPQDRISDRAKRE